MKLTDEGLDVMEKAAHEHKNFKLLLLIQILKEIRELVASVKKLEAAYQQSKDGSNGGGNC